MPTRNITLSLPDEVIRRAKVLAAQRETSVSALVGELLSGVVGEDSYDELWAQEEAVMAAGTLTVGPVTWTRDDLYGR